MHRRLSVSLLVASAASLSVFDSTVALAAGKDAAALKLDQAAINNDYLATKFGDAEKKLKQALAICGANNCSPKTLAQLHCDLGVVYFVGAKKGDDAKSQFTEALKADPTAAVAKELTSPEIEQIFAAAKGGGAVAALPPAPPTTASSDEISHLPAAEQAVLTAVPVYAELPEGMTPAKVQVRYKAFGASEWKLLDLNRLKTGYGGEIPCTDVGNAPGDLKYYIEAVDAKGTVIGTSGTRNAPYKVPIKSELSGEPPHLPGAPPPTQCGGVAAPVEAKPVGDKGAGAACTEDSQCQSGTCKDAVCAAPVAPEVAPSGEAKKNWLSLAVEQDLLLVPSVKDVCRDSSSGYDCFDSEGSYRSGRMQTIAGKGDEVAGGPSLATTRLLAGYDRLLTDNLTLGARAGYVLGGSPTKPGGSAFLPVHLEVRAAYVFGVNGGGPFTSAGPRPYVMAAGGLGQVDSKVAVKVYEGTDKTDVNAWKSTGKVFVALGGGLSYAITPATAIFAEIKIMQMFGASGTGGGLQIGFAQGL